MHKFQKYVINHLQSIEHRMPRKKSARRSHPLGPEYRVIEYLEVKISLLQITFGDYIETGQICFYPGEILDEISRTLRSIASTKTFDFHLILEDLIDLIDMAVEHFEQNIEPPLRENSASPYLPRHPDPLPKHKKTEY